MTHSIAQATKSALKVTLGGIEHETIARSDIGGNQQSSIIIDQTFRLQMEWFKGTPIADVKERAERALISHQNSGGKWAYFPAFYFSSLSQDRYTQSPALGYYDAFKEPKVMTVRHLALNCEEIEVYSETKNRHNIYLHIAYADGSSIELRDNDMIKDVVNMYNERFTDSGFNYRRIDHEETGLSSIMGMAT